MRSHRAVHFANYQSALPFYSRTTSRMNRISYRSLCGLPDKEKHRLRWVIECCSFDVSTRATVAIRIDTAHLALFLSQSFCEATMEEDILQEIQGNRPRSRTWPLPQPEDLVDESTKTHEEEPSSKLEAKKGSRKNAWGNLSYADLITQAITSSSDQRMTLSQIYTWMVENIPYFKDKGDSTSSAGWKVFKIKSFLVTILPLYSSKQTLSEIVHQLKARQRV